jgi:tRNA-guanine family transglycosylase
MTSVLHYYPGFFPMGLRDSILKYWKPLRHIYSFLSSDHVIDKSTMVSAYYLRQYALHNVRERLELDSDCNLFLDSGGYQVLTGELPAPTVNHAIELYDYFNEIQPQAAITLDYPFRPFVTSLEERKRRVAINHKLAALGQQMLEGSRIDLYAAIHAWDFRSARKTTAELKELGFRHFAIGAPSSVENNKSSITYLEFFSELLRGVYSVLEPQDRLHVLGISNSNALFLLAFYRVNSFDSMSYIHAAKYREYFLPDLTRVVVSQTKQELIELPCACPICLYVGENVAIFGEEGSQPGGLLSLHNLIAQLNYVKKLQSAIKKGWIDRLIPSHLQEWVKNLELSNKL